MNVKKKKYDVVSKGTCQYPQTENFVAAKQYLIVKENDKQYLLVRLVNNRTENVTGATLLVEQFNDRGEKISTDSVRVSGFTGFPKKSVTVETKIPVAPTCNDCRIIVTDAEFGKYEYSAQSDQPKYQLETKTDASPSVPSNVLKKAGKKGVTVELRSLKMPLVVLIVSLALLAAAFLAIWIYTLKYVSTAQYFLHNGVYYAFEDNDRSDGSDIYVAGVRGAKSEISVPKSIQGHKVVRVGDKAFYGNANLTKVTLDGEIAIGQMSFFGCTALETISFDNVTAISDRAFAGCIKLKSVEFESVKSIGENAFGGCSALSSVKIYGDESVLELGYAAFGNCKALRYVEIDRELDYDAMGEDVAVFDLSTGITELYLKNFVCDGGLRTITALFGGDIPALKTLVIDSIDSIGTALCYSLPLTTARFNGVQSAAIEDYAFFGCKNLTEVIMPTPAVSVGFGAFYGSAIKTFDGSALVMLGDDAFGDCKSLTSVALESNTQLEEIGAGAFKNCTELKSISIPANVTWLGAEVFSGCGNLTTVNFAEDSAVRIISQSAFEDCVSLAVINLPVGVTTLSSKTFSGCISLTSIELPDTLTTMGAEVFAGTGLTEITVPHSVTNIARGAFSGCADLNSITVPFVGGSRSSNRYLAYIFGAVNAYGNDLVPALLKSVTVTDSTTVADNAFYGCSEITSIVFENGIYSIGSSAFSGCASLDGIDFSALTGIGSNAFENCTAFTKVTLPDSLLYAGENSFKGCVNLAELTTPFVGYSRDRDGYLAFMFGGAAKQIPLSLKKVTVTDTATIGMGAFANTSVREVVLGESTRYISSDAFKNSRKLNVITLPEELLNIEDEAFYGCYLLYEVFNFSTLPIQVGSTENGYVAYYALKVHTTEESRLNSAMYNGFDFVENNNTWHLVSYPEEQTSFFLPEGENGVIIANGFSFTEYEVRGRLFRDNASIETVHIPANVNSVGVEAFYGCEKLRLATVDDGVGEICSSAFGGCVALTEFTFPSSVTTVADRLFYGCTALKTVSMQKSIVAGFSQHVVGEMAFYGCESLQEIALPVGYQAVDGYAFYGCTALTSVGLSTCTAIGEGAFSGCTALLKAVISDDCTAIGKKAFDGCTMLYDVSIPSACVTIGERAFYGCKRIKTVIVPEPLTAIGDNAFYGCTKLYEVYNLSTALAGEIRVREDSYGCVALYAFVVHDDAEEQPIDNIVTSSDLHYYKLGGTWYLVDYYGTSGELKIERFTYNNTEVGEIKVIENAFKGYTSIKSLEFDKSIKAIGDSAFYGCGALTSVSIVGEGNILIGDHAFYNCPLQSVKCEGGAYEIDSYAFAGKPVKQDDGDAGAMQFTADCATFRLAGSNVFAQKALTVQITGASEVYTAGNAFSGADIGSLVINADSVEIDRNDLYGATLYLEINGKQRVVLQDGAFARADFSSVTIGADSVEIGGNSFTGKITTDDKAGKVQISGEQSVVLNDNAFFGADIDSVTIDGKTVSVGNSSFTGNVTTVLISGTTTVTLDGYAFNTSSSQAITAVGDAVFVNEYAFVYANVQSLSLGESNRIVVAAYGVYNSTIDDITIDGDIISLSANAVVGSNVSGEMYIDGTTINIANDAFVVCDIGDLTIQGDAVFGDESEASVFKNVTIANLEICSQNINIAGNMFSGCTIGTITLDGIVRLDEFAFSGSDVETLDIATTGSELEIPHILDWSSTLMQLKVQGSTVTVQPSAFNAEQFASASLKSVDISADQKLSVSPLAFYGQWSLNSVKLTANKNAEIGENAFAISPYYNSNLSSIVLPKGLKQIEKNAFAYCTAVKELDIPDSVTAINSNAFVGCYSLKKLDLPDALKTVDSYAFYGCNDLASLILPETLQSIGSYAFGGCSSVTELTVPDSVVSIFDSAFSGCSNLTLLKLPSKLQSLGRYAFSGCYSLTALTVPDSITVISEYTFEFCYSLTLLKLPSKLQSIGYRAFYGCNKLTELTMPDSVTVIGDSAFSGCNKLASLRLSEKLEKIGNNSFSGCESLTELTVPDSVTVISANAFSGCSALTSLKLPKQLINLGGYAFSGCGKLTELTVPDSVEEINERAFFGCGSLAVLKLPKKLASIGSYAFYGCSALKQLEISGAINYIGTSAFENCTSLTSLTITPDRPGLTMQSSAFYKCPSLLKIEIRNLYYMGYGVFFDCKAVTDITLVFANSYGYENSIGNNAFDGCESVERISISASDNNAIGIYRYAFEYCGKLTQLTLNNVTYIDNSAFYGCGSLKELTLPDTVTYIGEFAFYDCLSLEKLTLSSSLSQIDKYAFANCSKLAYIELPASLRNIGDSAFQNATSLFAVYNRSSVVMNAGASESVAGGVAMYAAVVSNNKTEATLTYSQSGNYKFVRSGTGDWYIYDAADGTLPDSVTVPVYGKIEKYTIKCHTFEDYVEQIIIPTSVVCIQTAAFYGGIDSVYYKGTAEQWTMIDGYYNAGWNVYYYVKCVHGSYQWTADKDGNIIDEIAEREWRVDKAPTCKDKGLMGLYCTKCNARFDEKETNPDPDAHSYKGGTCTHCGKKDPDYKDTAAQPAKSYYIDEKNILTRELELND